MQKLVNALSKNPVVYVTRDIERALGLPINIRGYYIITNQTSFAKQVTKGKKNILLIKNKSVLDTWELLNNKKVIKFINQLISPKLLVFKNTLQIEIACNKNGWSLLNPKLGLANQVENKLSQLEWLGPFKKYLPPTQVKTIKALKWPQDKEKVIQFNRAHTGQGTIKLASKKILNNLKNKFPERKVRVTKFINGLVYTSNVVVWQSEPLIGNISYQITGLKPFTDQPFATVGNDWAMPHSFLTKKQAREFCDIAQSLGKQLQRVGWNGLFGVDMILEEKTNKLYLLEINARQPASATCEAWFQLNKKKSTNSKYLTVAEMHLASLLGLKQGPHLPIALNNGAQIIQRVTSRTKNRKYKIKNTRGVKSVAYPNTKLGQDLLRLHCKYGLMQGHNKLNTLGEKIKEQLS